MGFSESLSWEVDVTGCSSFLLKNMVFSDYLFLCSDSYISCYGHNSSLIDQLVFIEFLINGSYTEETLFPK